MQINNLEMPICEYNYAIKSVICRYEARSKWIKIIINLNKQRPIFIVLIDPILLIATHLL